MILINLLPPELRRKEAPKISMPEIPVKKTLLILGTGVLALQLLLSVVAVFYSTRYKIAQYETVKMSSKLQEVRMAKKQTAIVAKKMQDIRTLTEKRFYWARVLNELSMTTTRGIWLRSLEVEELTVQKPSEEKTAKADPKAKKDKKAKPAKEVKKPAGSKKTEKKKPAKDDSGADKKPAVTSEVYHILKLEGSCVGSAGQETALIGKYLKSLHEDPYFKELFGDDIDLSGMNQRKLGEADVFDFTVNCRFKKEKL